MQIDNVSEAAFAALRERLLQNHRAEITGTTEGVISGQGVKANYRYDGATRTLNVEVIHRPFFIPVSAIESQLRAAVASAQENA